MQPLPPVQWQGGRDGAEESARVRLALLLLRQGPVQAQPGRVPEWRGRPPDPAPARRRHTRGAPQPRHLLPEAGQHSRGPRAHEGH